MTTYLTSTDISYSAELRGYNLAVEHHPAVIAPVASVEEVIDAVGYARDHGLGIAVQATGHGPSRPADGQMLVTTSRMDSIEIDPLARVARVGAGVRGGALVAAAAEHGLAPVNGSSPEVGVISYHLGGGLGILGRTLGWAVDHVRSLEIVTADGSLRQVSPGQEPELFWALRGGGKGTLGIVVSLEIDLHPISRIHGGGMHFTGDSAVRALRSWARWTRTVPEEMSSSALIVTMPDLSVVPEPLRGRRVVHLRFASTGTAEEAARLVQPFRDLAPVTDTVAEMAYVDVGTIHAEPTTPVAFHARNLMLDSLPPDAVDELLREAGPASEAPHLVELRHAGGALARPGAHPSSLARRDGAYVLYAGGAAEGAEAPPLRAALDHLVESMEPWGTGGVCVNFLSGPDVTAAQYATGFLDEDVARLAAIKRAVDPDDLFRTHHGRA